MSSMLPVKAPRPRIRPMPISPPRFPDDEPVSGIIERAALRADDEYEEVDEREIVLIADD